MFAGGFVPPLMPVSEFTNFRLCVDAATAVTHGAFAGEPIVRAAGPELPAATEANTPASRAPRKDWALASDHGSRDPPPIEKLITSTPSATAWSIAAVVSADRHPAAVQAL